MSSLLLVWLRTFWLVNLLSERRLIPGKVFPKLREPAGVAEICEVLKREWFDNQLFIVMFGAGGVKNHLIFDPKVTVSICGRYVDQVGGQLLVTSRGVLCYTCVHLWKTAFVDWLTEQETQPMVMNETNMEIKSIIASIRTIVHDNPKMWFNALTGVNIPIK